MHLLVKSVVTSCVGLALSSLIGSSVLGIVCITHLGKQGLCLHAPQISLSELTSSCGLDLDCLRIAILSLAHMTQFFAVNVLTALIGLPCKMMLRVQCLLQSSPVLASSPRSLLQSSRKSQFGPHWISLSTLHWSHPKLCQTAQQMTFPLQAMPHQGHLRNTLVFEKQCKEADWNLLKKN